MRYYHVFAHDLSLKLKCLKIIESTEEKEDQSHKQETTNQTSSEQTKNNNNKLRPTIGDKVVILNTGNTRSHIKEEIDKEGTISADNKDYQPYQIQGHKPWLFEEDVTMQINTEDEKHIMTVKDEPGTVYQTSEGWLIKELGINFQHIQMDKIWFH